MAATELMSALSGTRVPTVKAALSYELADLVVNLLVKISPPREPKPTKAPSYRASGSFCLPSQRKLPCSM